MSKVRIPPVMRPQAGGAKELEIEGATAGQVLQNLAQRFPSLQDQLFEDGNLRRYVNVYVNDEDIQYLDKLNTAVGPNDTLIILPAMAGGQLGW